MYRTALEKVLLHGDTLHYFEPQKHPSLGLNDILFSVTTKLALAS